MFFFFVSEWQLINYIIALVYVQEVCVLRFAKKSKHISMQCME